MNRNSDLRSGRVTRSASALRTISYLLIGISLGRFFSLLLAGTLAMSVGQDALARLLGEVTASVHGTAAQGALAAIIGIELLLSALQLASGILGTRLSRGNGRPETVETLAIVMAGLALISWLCGLVAHVITGVAPSIALLAQALVLPGLLYFFARRQLRNRFWSGIKQAKAADARKPLIDVVQRYALSPSGMLVAADTQQRSVVEFLSLDEFDMARTQAAGERMLSRNARIIRHCTANTFGSSILGTIRVPHAIIEIAGLPFADDVRFAFELTSDRLTVISDEESAQQLMAYYTMNQMIEKKSAAAVLFELLEYLVMDNSAYLFDLSDRLSRLEDNMGASVTDIPRDFDAYISGTRSRLHVLNEFYRQLADLADSIASSPCDSIPPQAIELFRALSGRGNRLSADARGVSSYAQQIREMYQTKIDLRQNKVMTLLTIVTTIFMPLTLITGWYGMNFDVMPELHNPYGYYIVMAVTIAIVTVEVVAFKRRKWF